MASTAAALVVGVVIGASIVFGALYASGSLPSKTTTITMTSTSTTLQTLIVTTTVTTTPPPSGFTSTAIVSTQVTSCVGATDVCTIALTNSGTASVQAIGCFMQLNGVSTPPESFTPATVEAGGNATVTCGPPVAVVAQAAGSQAFGSISLNNGGAVPFSGVWS